MSEVFYFVAMDTTLWIYIQYIKMKVILIFSSPDLILVLFLGSYDHDVISGSSKLS